MISRLNTRDPDFETRFAALRELEASGDASIAGTVRKILADVQACGDDAVVGYTNRFDRRSVASAAELELELSNTMRDSIAADLREALLEAHGRILRFHERQVERSWQYEDADGTVLGQQITALERVGVYVPGGKAAYPSSVLMNVVPAKVAGVEEIIMVVPAADGQVDPVVLAAADIAGVDRIFTIGGAQAIGALAFGTETIPAVDKIVGPGNAYVAEAKSQVFGTVGIDMIAGPSEILIVCDGQTSPEWIAMDLFSQAEHDELAQSILISPDRAYLDAVADAITALLPQMERREIIATSLGNRGALIAVEDLDEAIELVNRIAPEHLELSVADPERLLPRVKHAGAIFMGRHTAESLGDYCAGPNHVLPTSGTARFFSPLGVYDFQKRSSIIRASAESAAVLGSIASTLARGERLTAHARSAEYRIDDQKSD